MGGQTLNGGAGDTGGWRDAMLPAVSIIMEWENAKLSELGRSRALLRALSDQTRALSNRFESAPELLVLYDAEAISEPMIRSVLDAELEQAGPLALRLMPARGQDYYGLKNLGAEAATRGRLLFVDSDVIPEAGWLEALLETSAAHPDAVIAGATHLETGSFTGRAFGLFWFFPFRRESNAVQPANAFFANSVVFPAGLFKSFHGFAPTGSVRGACGALAARLRSGGVPILLARGARADHPAPNGFGHFVKRAICQGHDAQIMDDILARPRALGSRWAQIGARLARNWTKTARAVLAYRSGVHMPRIETPAALLMGLSYYALYSLGEVLALAAPGFVFRRLRV